MGTHTTGSHRPTSRIALAAISGTLVLGTLTACGAHGSDKFDSKAKALSDKYDTTVTSEQYSQLQGGFSEKIELDGKKTEVYLTQVKGEDEFLSTRGIVIDPPTD